MKNKLFLFKIILLFCFASFSAFAQIDEKIYDTPEVQAEYPAGLAVMFKFLSANIKYPIFDKNKVIQTKVVLSFTVEKDGTIRDFVPRKKDYFTAVDSAVIRAFQLMPKWIPAKQNGEIVRSKYVFPIMIKLEE